MTSSKFATGINDTSGTGGKNLPLVSLKPVANLPLLQLIPVANTGVVFEYLRKFSKIRKWPLFYFQGLGERWFMKKLKSKISWHCPFKGSGHERNILNAYKVKNRFVYIPESAILTTKTCRSQEMLSKNRLWQALQKTSAHIRKEPALKNHVSLSF
jgi:hypothetical protein